MAAVAVVDGGAAEMEAAAAEALLVKGEAVAPEAAKRRRRRGFLTRMWRGIFGPRSEDFEKKLQHLSREEAVVHARMKRRGASSRRMARNVIVLAVIVEVVAVAYAIMTTRSVELNWHMRAVRVLPMFLLPGLSSAIYSTLLGFTRMLDRKDQKTLDKLRAERKEKIDELKERTNYYSTQQLIQRYDLDPAAKAAAAAALASKLGADSGLKVFLGDESKTNVPLDKNNDVELVQSGGLRNREQGHVRSKSTESTIISQVINETSVESGADRQMPGEGLKVVEHFRGSGSNDGGWIGRIAALLVGENPSRSYALICGDCHMHNGLVRKEDFPYATYYCPHCHALNQTKQSGEDSGTSSDKASPSLGGTHPTPEAKTSSIAGGETTTKMAAVQDLLVGPE